VASHSGTRHIYLRALGSLEARPVAGTEEANTPFFSTDGQWLGFFVGGKLKKISVSGGAAVTVVNIAGGNPRGAAWGGGGTIAFSPSLNAAIQRGACESRSPMPAVVSYRVFERRERLPRILRKVVADSPRPEWQFVERRGEARLFSARLAEEYPIRCRQDRTSRTAWRG
jgi:hypothetical protein